MASGIKLIGVFIFWIVLGLSWAILNENAIDKLDDFFPDPYTLDNNTFDIMIWAWKISVIGLCIGSAISILGQRGFRAAIVNSLVIFCGLFVSILLWAAFWTPANVTIPTAFASGFNVTSTSNQYLQVYNGSFLFLVCGLCLLTFFSGGTAIIGRRRYRSRRIIPQKRKDYVIDISGLGKRQRKGSSASYGYRTSKDTYIPTSTKAYYGGAKEVEYEID